VLSIGLLVIDVKRLLSLLPLQARALDSPAHASLAAFGAAAIRFGSKLK
jgi:hypothetical protein